jgi:DNA adenine methylase
VDIPEWYRLQPYKQVRCVTDANFLELAWAGIFFNRVNYSGIIGAKPIGGIDQNSKYKMGCRFNRESLISKIYQIHRISHSFDLALGDGIRQLATHYGENSKFDWAYIDPPYFKNGRKFYRYFYNAFDHKRLRDALGQINLPWLLSYDAVDAVRNLYADFQIGEASWLQSAKKAKIVQEILVSNVSLYPSDEQEEFDLETEWPTKKGASGCFYSSLQQSNKTSTS